MKKAKPRKGARARRPAPRAGEDVFIRFGDLPEGGRSRNYRTGRLEPGVSVYRATRTPEGGYVLGPLSAFERSAAVSMFVLGRRPPFEVTGREVGVGSAGEPVLAEARATPIPRSAVEPIPWTRKMWRELVLNTAPSERALLDLKAPPPGWADLWRSGYWGPGGVPSHATEPEDDPGTASRAVDAAGMGEGLSPHVVEAVFSRSTGKHSRIHGPEHWKRVAAAGAALAGDAPGADLLVVLLFALFHDAMRLGDGRDPSHGSRAANLARELLEDGRVLSAERLSVLALACERHDDGGVSGDPTIGTCWDADRLNLWRVGVEPDPTLLSTAAARFPRRIAWARRLQGEALAWDAVIRTYDRMKGESWT